MEYSFFLKGNICHTPSRNGFEIYEKSYLLCENGLCGGIFPTIPDKYAGLPVKDRGDCLIFPGMVDLHIHAPQFAFRGTGMDYELLDWLKMRTFPEEAKYAEPAYAEKAYSMFSEALAKSATTRAVIFGTIHREATLCLMDLMERTGIVSFVGKVNMDRDAPPELTEPGADSSAFDTLNGIKLYNRQLRMFLTELYIVVIGTSNTARLVDFKLYRFLLPWSEADFSGHIHISAIK